MTTTLKTRAVAIKSPRAQAWQKSYQEGLDLGGSHDQASDYANTRITELMGL